VATGADGVEHGFHTPVLYRMLRAAVRPIVRLLLRPRVSGLEHVPETGPAILCANHLSNIDPVLVGVLVPRAVVYLGKREWFRGPVGALFRALGVVPVAREGGSAAQAALDRGVDVLRHGAVLGIYPEGTRSPDGRMYRGRTGPIRLAARSDAPLIPVGIVGTREAMPPHAWIPRPHRASVAIGPPQWVEGPLEEVDLRAQADELMDRIAALSGQEQVDAYARGPGGPRQGPGSTSP
jgi:1-acyl-sn-glycerol-3-phosphate acyltransferase